MLALFSDIYQESPFKSSLAKYKCVNVLYMLNGNRHTASQSSLGCDPPASFLRAPILPWDQPSPDWWGTPSLAPLPSPCLQRSSASYKPCSSINSAQSATAFQMHGSILLKTLLFPPLLTFCQFLFLFPFVLFLFHSSY